MIPNAINAIRFASISEYATWCWANGGTHPGVNRDAFVRTDGAAITHYWLPPELVDEWLAMSFDEARSWILSARGVRAVPHA